MPQRRAALVGLVAGAAVGLAGCAATPPATQACRTPQQASLMAELLLGLSMPGGGVVTQAMFDGFVARELSPRFPDGLTVLAGDGRYKPPGGTPAAEDARIVMIVAPDDAATAAKLRAAGAAYRAQFHQHSIGLITVQSCAAF